MKATPTLDKPLPALLDWLRTHGIDYDVHEHAEAFTARATATAEGVDPHTFAKVVVIQADDGRMALAVLDATDHLDLEKARQVLGAGRVRLLTEDEMAELAADCEVGAMPAVGPLYGLVMYADNAVREDPGISFNAGSHRISVRVDRARWEQACDVAYADLAVGTESRPAWARS